MIANVLGFIEEDRVLFALLSPAGFKCFFVMRPVQSILEPDRNGKRDLGLIALLCIKAEELTKNQPGNRVFENVKKTLDIALASNSPTYEDIISDSKEDRHPILELNQTIIS